MQTMKYSAVILTRISHLPSTAADIRRRFC
jgi:hypothetical protein